MGIEPLGSPSQSDVAYFSTAFCQVSASAWQIQLVLGDAQLAGKPGEPIREVPRMVVGIPWPLAKALWKILGISIEQFEMQEGSISIPRSVEKSLERFGSPGDQPK